MGDLTPPAFKRNPKKWKLLDLVMAIVFGMVFLFFLMIFTPLGDSLADSGRQSLLLFPSDPKQRQRLASLIEAGYHHQPIEPCPSEYVDYMPCEDPRRNSHLSRHMNFYRERHCPAASNSPLCLIPYPASYRTPIPWPQSLHKIWHSNMPHNKIADRKGHQGWMKEEGDYFIFPGGGTMFPEGAIPYIEKLSQHIPIGNGAIRTALDMGCGVASFGGYLLEKGILPLSFAPRDSHKSQIQFALERGIPSFSLMLGTRRLPFPAFVFDFVHCSRCLIPFTAYNATYFLEVDRVLRPGGYFVISGPPVQWAKQEKEWSDLQAIAGALTYELLAVDGNTVVWQKPKPKPKSTRLPVYPITNEFGIHSCEESEDPNNAWYYNVKKCVTLPTSVERDVAVGTIPEWPDRLNQTPPRAAALPNGGNLFAADTRRWQRRVSHYISSLNVKLGSSEIRNIMDMNALFGGFAAALIEYPVWVMNTVPPVKKSTLDVIFDRGLIGVYHDWCEPFSTYPRSYDMIHAAGIQGIIKQSSVKGCNLVDVMVEMDRILRPGGTVVIRDSPEVIERLARVAAAVRWTATSHHKEPNSQGTDRILVATKTFWKTTSSP